MPCIEALAAALEFSMQQTWPVVLEQLTTAQWSFLLGRPRHAQTPAQLVNAFHEMPQLAAELNKALQSGTVEQAGGCTDTAVRLTNVLKVSASTSKQADLSDLHTTGASALAHLIYLTYVFIQQQIKMQLS